MRLWHYELIPVLPKEMLVSQWRECIAIKRQWEKGTLKHRLVSYVMNYDKGKFFNYVNLVCLAMEGRNIKYQDKYYDEFDEYLYLEECEKLLEELRSAIPEFQVNQCEVTYKQVMILNHCNKFFNFIVGENTLNPTTIYEVVIRGDNENG